MVTSDVVRLFITTTQDTTTTTHAAASGDNNNAWAISLDEFDGLPDIDRLTQEDLEALQALMDGPVSLKLGDLSGS